MASGFMGEGVGADAGVGLVAAGEGVGVAPGVAGVGVPR